MQKIGTTFPIVGDAKNVAHEVFKIQGTPTNLLIDKNGMIVFHHLGFGPGEEKVLEAEVESLVKATPVNTARAASGVAKQASNRPVTG